MLKGGGIGQPSDPPGGSSYFDPILQHNGKAERVKGYCSDIFAEAAIDFIGQSARPPVLRLSRVQLPARRRCRRPSPSWPTYRAMNLTLKEFPQLGQPIPAGFDAPAEMVARVYAMVTNIDTNVGKVLKALEDRRDWPTTRSSSSSPTMARPRCGSTRACGDWKGSVYDGGIRVPCYIRWPGHFPAGRRGRPDRRPYRPDADVARRVRRRRPRGRAVRRQEPASRCSRESRPPAGPTARSTSSGTAATSPSSAGPSPRVRKRTSSCATSPRPASTKVPPLELYDMEHDPLELHDIAKEHPDIVSKMYADYKAWFQDVSSTRGYRAGPDRTRQRAREPHDPDPRRTGAVRGPAGNANDLGYWEVEVAEAGRFDITLHVLPRQIPSRRPPRVRSSPRGSDRIWSPIRPNARSRESTYPRALDDWKRGSRGTDNDGRACST